MQVSQQIPAAGRPEQLLMRPPTVSNLALAASSLAYAASRSLLSQDGSGHTWKLTATSPQAAELPCCTTASRPHSARSTACHDDPPYARRIATERTVPPLQCPLLAMRRNDARLHTSRAVEVANRHHDRLEQC